MAKPRTVFVCSSCGADAPRWSGQCPSCGEWNTLAPFAEARVRGGGRQGLAGRRASGGRRATRDGARDAHGDGLRRVRSRPRRRPRAGFGDADRRRAGHRQVDAAPAMRRGARGRRRPCCTRPARNPCGRWPSARAGWASATRGSSSSPRPRSSASSPPSAETGATVLVIDSIQTMSVADVDAAPGAVTQLRESTASLVRHAKSTGTVGAPDRARDARRA